MIEEGQFWVAPIIKRQADLDRLLSHPLGVPVTDGMASHPVKHRDFGIMPKTFGSFPQILGRYVRDAGVMTLEHAVHQMTQVPAERMQITDRGVLADGLAADLFIFDPATIANRATEQGDVAARPAGVMGVMVNGRWVVRDGAATGERPGRALSEPGGDEDAPGAGLTYPAVGRRLMPLRVAIGLARRRAAAARVAFGGRAWQRTSGLVDRCRGGIVRCGSAACGGRRYLCVIVSTDG